MSEDIYISTGMKANIIIPIMIRPGMYEEIEKIRRLCEAAPDLLKACKGVLPGLEGLETLQVKNIYLDNLRAAINKAEGIK